MRTHFLSLMRGGALAAVLAFAVPAGAAAPNRPAPTTSDAYIAGYVAAVLEREFRLTGPAFQIQNGVVTVYAGDLNEVQQDKIASILAGVRGVSAVRVTAGPPPPRAPNGPGAADIPSWSPPAGPSVLAAAQSKDEPGLEVLPRGNLFDPLIADPRWAHFSAAYQYFVDDEEIEHAGAVSFGETFGLLGGPAPFDGRWQFDFQAAVFGLFDLDSDSKDLINADYWVGLPLSYRSGPYSAMLRVFHQSSHLGDEFLLRDRVDRVNLSYEAVDLKLSYEVGRGLRVYGGLGYLLNVEPEGIDPFSTQVGAEYLAPFTLGDGLLRPVAAADLQNREESDFATDLSLRAGVQFESPAQVSQRLQLLIEYFNGRNPNGQFYDRTLEYIGLGAHVYF